MNTITIADKAFETFSRIVFLTPKGQSNLQVLHNWEQPLQFKPNSNILNQIAPGPCGFFAVLQSHIILQQKELGMNASEKETVLYSIILEIFQKLSSYLDLKFPEQNLTKDKVNFVFCEGFDSTQSKCTFQFTDSYDMAYSYLLQTDYLNQPNACLLLTLSFIFASIGMTRYINLPSEPYISDDKMTSMGLVWLILNGSTDDSNLADAENSDYKGIAQTGIGIKVCKSMDKRVIGTWLNKQAKIFICLTFVHFFAAVEESDNDVLIYDALGNGQPRKLTKASLNW